MPIGPGHMLGHYRLIEKIGEGGMGQVFLAEDTRLKRRVALKVLPEEFADDPSRVKRFRREAEAAAALNHPHIVTLYSVEQVDRTHFLTMELVEGEDLGRLIRPAGAALEQMLGLGIAIADALATAHSRGIVHRDLKPANVMVSRDGRAKVLDFGLAKLRVVNEARDASTASTRDLSLTTAGTTMGTLPYMSPEQVQGRPLDHRTDIFSLGVVLYELATGRRPFVADNTASLASSILTETPRAVAAERPDLPRRLGRIIHRCLEKDTGPRFQTAGAVRNELERLRRGLESRSLLRRPAVVASLVIGVLVTAAVAYLPYRSYRRLERARLQMTEAESLASSGAYAGAFGLAVQAEQVVPDDPMLAILWPEISDRLTVRTEPAGARVYLEQPPSARGEVRPRKLVGVTPVVDRRIARAEYRVWLEKDGFVALETVISSALNRAEGRLGVEPDVELDEVLPPAGTIPADMVPVRGGEYTVRGYGFPRMAAVTLEPFLIDRYEISNAQFLEFIRAGGYANRSYWKHPLIRDGSELSFDEALELLRDRSGLPGPRNWINQESAEGEKDHPVTGVNWYEAAAYAEYAGKTLPTIYQWEQAARAGRYTHFEGTVMPWGLMGGDTSAAHRANFAGRGTVAVDSHPFGMSPFGAYNMAGNIEEWCVNERGAGRTTAGGSFVDPPYVFSTGGSRPAFEAASTIGFRCVSKAAETAADQGSHPIESRRSVRVGPVDDATFRSLLSHYRYDRKSGDVQILETVEHPDWTREKVEFEGAGRDPILAYLYLPKRAQAPYQCINYMVSSTVLAGRTAAEEVEAILAPQIKAGRAVMVVVPLGALERERPGYESGAPGTVKARDEAVLHVTEQRMGLDYLEARGDIDMSRVAHIGFSSGAEYIATLFTAVEDRIRSSIFIAADLWPSRALPEVNPANFASRIQGPVLMLMGRHDEVSFNWRALFELLPEPKQLELVDSGHLPPVERRNPIIRRFLDETLGPVDGE